MKSIIWLVRNNIKVMFRKKFNIFIYIFLPVLLSLATYSLMAQGGNAKTTIGIVNQDSGKLSKDFVSFLESNNNFKVCYINKNGIENSLLNDNFDSVISIPDDFTYSVYNNPIKKIKVYTIKGADVTGWIKSYTNNFIQSLSDIASASKNNADLFDKIYNAYKNQKLKVISKGIRDVSRSKASTVQSIGFLTMFLLYGSTTVANLILKEKQSRTFFRICSSPVNGRTYILANAISNFCVMLIQVCCLLAALRFILKVQLYCSIGVILVPLLVFSLVCVGFGLLLVAFSDSTSQVSNLSTLIIVPSSMLGGCYWDISMMPKYLQKVSNFMPQKWLLDAIGKLQEGKSISQISSTLIIMLLFALVFFSISIYKFQQNDSVKNVI